MTYRLALFDFDGVLADSAGWFVEQLPSLADRHGFRSPDAAEIERLRRLPTREVVKAMGVSPLRLPAIASDLRKRMAADAERIALFDGVPEMLTSLAQRGVRFAVVSSNSEANVRTVLGPHAKAVAAFSCGSALFGKAARFSKLLKQLDVPAASACAVGDEVRDIEAARKARIASVAVTWGYGAAEALLQACPDHLTRTPAEVLAVVSG